MFADLTDLVPVSMGPSAATGEWVVAFPDDESLDATLQAALKARIETPVDPVGALRESLVAAAADGLPDLGTVRAALLDVIALVVGCDTNTEQSAP